MLDCRTLTRLMDIKLMLAYLIVQSLDKSLGRIIRISWISKAKAFSCNKVSVGQNRIVLSGSQGNLKLIPRTSCKNFWQGCGVRGLRWFASLCHSNSKSVRPNHLSLKTYTWSETADCWVWVLVMVRYPSVTFVLLNHIVDNNFASNLCQ